MTLQPRPFANGPMAANGEMPVNGMSTDGATPPALLNYWQIALRWKWVILGILLASLIAGFVATALMSPKYSATTRIEISREEKNVADIGENSGTDTVQNQEFYQTQYSLLQAETIAERIVRDLRLANRPEFFAAHKSDMGEGFSLFDVKKREVTQNERTRRERAAIKLLRDNITIAPIRGSALIDISYTSASAPLSAEIANNWVKQFIDSSMERKFASTSDARAFLEGRLNELRGKVEISERDLVNYAADKEIIALSKSTNNDGKTEVQQTLAATNLQALNEALAQATADRVSAESRIRGASSGSSNEALNNVATSGLRQRRAEVSAEYAKMMVQFEPGYPAARALAEQIRTLDSAIAKEEARIQSRFQNNRNSDYREALQREQLLKAQVENYKRRLDMQQRDTIQYNIYQREADTNRELYDGLLQKFKQIGVAGVGANNIAIVDTAKIPEIPTSPKLPLNLALAMLAGVLLSGGAVIALNQLDEGLREPNQVARLLQIPLLGSVPDVEDKEALDMLADVKSEMSEAYLSIRSNLAFTTDHGVPRALMVTSTRAAEGKSTTSFALATVLGRTGKSVILIDADMRSPSMHGFLKMSNPSGLSNFLAGDNEWRAHVRKTEAKGLSLLSAGPMPPSAAELLSGDRMLMLVRQLLDHFDHVVVDAPPILGLADAPLLSRAVEGCVFVIEAEGVAVRGIKSSLGRLQAVQAHVFGGVLTKLQKRQSGFGYGYGYGYGYGDDRDAEKPAV